MSPLSFVQMAFHGYLAPVPMSFIIVIELAIVFAAILTFLELVSPICNLYVVLILVLISSYFYSDYLLSDTL
jgi:hypothetical protein